MIIKQPNPFVDLAVFKEKGTILCIQINIRKQK